MSDFAELRALWAFFHVKYIIVGVGYRALQCNIYVHKNLNR